MVAVWFVVTASVDTVKFALVWPAGTVTAAATVAAPLLLESATVKPPVGAAASRVTVPVLGEPPCTLVGLSVRLVGTIGWMVSAAD